MSVESILYTILVIVTHLLIFLLGKSTGFTAGHSAGFNFAKTIYSRDRKPGEVIYYNAKTGEEIPPEKEKTK